MRNQGRNIGSAALALAGLLAWDVAVMTADSLTGSETRRLSAQETEVVRGTADEERMFMDARRALNREEFELAAELFQALREKYPVTSGYVGGNIRLGRFVPDSYYWEAFGRYRQGNLDEALLLLDLVRVYPEAQRMYREDSVWRTGRLHADIQTLRTRIRRQLAEQGDPDAAEEVLREAEVVLTRDTAALREMRQQYEARTREALAQWAAEQERMERAVQEAIAESRAQWDSVGLQEHLRQRDLQEQYRGQVEPSRTRIQMLQPDSLGGSVLAYDPFGRYPGPVIVGSAGDLTFLDFFPGRDDPIVLGLDTERCEDALAQQEALVLLLRLEVDVMPTVRDILARDDECSAHLRYLSVNWLGGEDTDEARDLLTEVAGEHPDSRTREWAVTKLANFESPEVAEVLKNFLSESNDSEVQDAAILGLYHQDSDESNRALIDFASDGSKAEIPRQRAAVLVAERLTEGSVRGVFDRLDSDVVKRAYLGVVGARVETGELGDASWLLPVVADSGESEDVRAAALEAWSRQPSLDLDQVERTYRMLTSAEMRDKFLYALYQKAESDEENADAVIDKMIELARQETDPEVRRRAIYWLGRTGSDRAAAFLQEILRDGSGWPSLASS